MPIGGVSSLGNTLLNLFSKLFKLITEKPQYLFVYILVMLFLPLEFVDMLLWIIINFFILFAKALIWVFILVPNIFIWVANLIIKGLNLVFSGIALAINGLITILATGINWIIKKLGNVVEIALTYLFIPINGLISGINKLTPYPFPDIPTVSVPTVSFASWTPGIWGGIPGTPLIEFNLISFSAFTIPYVNINIFGTVGSGAWLAVLAGRDITCFFDMIGIAGPIW